MKLGDTPEVVALRQEIEELKQKIRYLEFKVGHNDEQIKPIFEDANTIEIRSDQYLISFERYAIGGIRHDLANNTYHVWAKTRDDGIAYYITDPNQIAPNDVSKILNEMMLRCTHELAKKLHKRKNN